MSKNDHLDARTTRNTNFIALHEVELDQSRLLAIKREDLLPLLESASALTNYADDLIQHQNQLLLSKSVQSSQELSQVIRHMIDRLNQSKKYLGQKKYNFIQRWFGIDLEQQASSVNYLNELNQLIDSATRLSNRVSTEIYQSQKVMKSLHDLRIDMAHYVVAAEQFMHESDHFTQVNHFESLKDRLQKKVNTLMTSQTATDMAMLQIQLSQNVAMTILDRFNEAKNVLIPSWQQHVLNLAENKTPQELQLLNESRERLIQTLDRAVKTSNQ